MYQLGGIDPLDKVPNFKYTFNEPRKLLIGTIYPYAGYFLDLVTKIPFDSYVYNGANDLFFEKNVSSSSSLFDKKEKEYEIKTINCRNVGTPHYNLFGGCVYEILNKKYKNIDLHRYCDATSDIDVEVYPPKLQCDEPIEPYLFFLNRNKEINHFYENFSSWIFNQMKTNLLKIKSIIEKISPSIVDFDINDYDDIPKSNKNINLGYKVEKIGNYYLVAFLDDDINMFKIQIVCKVIENDISVVDHIVEIIIPLRESSESFDPISDAYKLPQINKLLIAGQTYNLENYDALFSSNVKAYLFRKGNYGDSNEKDGIHKAINHIARILYLYELFYLNIDIDEFKSKLTKLPILFLYSMKPNEQSILKELNYYKIVDSSFNKIKIDTRYLLNCYILLIKKNEFAFNNFTNNIGNYTNINGHEYFKQMSLEDEKTIHYNFIQRLFNEDLFVSTNGLLTFDTVGGKKLKRKTKKKRKNKRNSTKKQKKIKNKK